MTDDVVVATRKWVESVVIGLNLCPFAKRDWVNQRVRIKHSGAQTNEALLQDLVVELAALSRNPDIETTLVVHPDVLEEFGDYNQFLDFADVLLEQMSLDGIYQIASFHPQYQFDGSQSGDVENYSNRSPFPMLHILRESSLESAIETHPDTGVIPVNNIAKLRGVGAKHMQQLLSACYD